jgi:hypothetical protein
MKLDLNDDNVFVVEIPVHYAREIDIVSPDTGAPEKILEALDNAQAKVFTDEHECSYLVIKITKGEL